MEYQKYAAKIQESANDTFRYLNFDKIPEYVSKGNAADLGSDYSSIVKKEVEKLHSGKWIELKFRRNFTS